MSESGFLHQVRLLLFVPNEGTQTDAFPVVIVPLIDERASGGTDVVGFVRSNLVGNCEMDYATRPFPWRLGRVNLTNLSYGSRRRTS